MTGPVKWIVGNWKMNGCRADTRDRVTAMAQAFRAEKDAGYEIVLCPPATVLSFARAVLSELYDHGEIVLSLGGQDCHAEAQGAYTGDISAEMLADAGASYVIAGHSERRQAHGESDDIVAAKARAALRAGLRVIVCVGETAEERAAGRHKQVVAAQVEASLPAEVRRAAGQESGKVIVAYEPVWAIGTGKTASLDDVAEMHGHLRSLLGPEVPLLYGGSVKPGNAADILALPAVDGVLVGGASLEPADFVAIARAAT